MIAHAKPPDDDVPEPGKTPPESGGQGGELTEGPSFAALDDPHHRRIGARMVARAVREGWFPVTPDIGARTVARVDAAMDDAKDDPRAVGLLAGVVTSMVAQNLRGAEAVDKSDRLDAGELTEALGVAPVTRITIEREAGG